MWSSEVNDLVGEVEELVQGSFVTYALMNGQRPSLSDAVLAARFSGCTSVAVLVLGGGDGRHVELIPAAGLGEISSAISGCPREPSAVAEAFFNAVLAQPAACA